MRLTIAALVLALAAPAAALRLVRSTSGSKGSLQGGRYLIEDPRTAFQAGQDRQVVVFFEWEGTPGRHHCEASWRDPSGRVVLQAPTDYDARAARFGIYWTLALPESPATGLWAVEARVDGEPAGTHTFQVSEGAVDPAAVAKRMLAPKELYARLVASTVAIEALDPAGERLWTGSGFYLAPQRLVTAFQVLEGATSLRVLLPDGHKLDDVKIVSANRRQDWAVLATPPTSSQPLVRAAQPLAVGDHASFLDSSPDGSQTLRETSVTGRREAPGSGVRLNLMSGWTVRTNGAPLLDERGDVAGLVGGSLVPGLGLSSGGLLRIAGADLIPQSGLAVPIEAIPETAQLGGESFPVSALLERGLVVPPLSREERVQDGLVARGEATALQSITDASRLSRRDGVATVRITWDSRQPVDSEATFRVFDVDNLGVMASKPVKVKLRPGEVVISTWKMPVANLSPGTYRIDLSLADAIVWRSFVTVAD